MDSLSLTPDLSSSNSLLHPLSLAKWRFWWLSQNCLNWCWSCWEMEKLCRDGDPGPQMPGPTEHAQWILRPCPPKDRQNWAFPVTTALNDAPSNWSSLGTHQWQLQTANTTGVFCYMVSGNNNDTWDRWLLPLKEHYQARSVVIFPILTIFSNWASLFVYTLYSSCFVF